MHRNQPARLDLPFLPLALRLHKSLVQLRQLAGDAGRDDRVAGHAFAKFILPLSESLLVDLPRPELRLLGMTQSRLVVLNKFRSALGPERRDRRQSRDPDRIHRPGLLRRPHRVRSLHPDEPSPVRVALLLVPLRRPQRQPARRSVGASQIAVFVFRHSCRFSCQSDIF